MAVAKRDRTRNQLLIAAQTLALEGGSGALSVNNLSEKSELALGTFYNYYRSREDVMLDICALLVSACRQDVTAATSGLEDPVEIVAASLNQTLHTALPGSDIGRLMFETSLSMEPFMLGVRRFFRRDLEEGVKQGAFNVKAPDAVVSMVSGSCLGVMQDVYAGRLAVEMIPEVTESILKQLGVDSGLAHRQANAPMRLQPCRQLPLVATDLLPPLGPASKARQSIAEKTNSG